MTDDLEMKPEGERRWKDAEVGTGRRSKEESFV